MVDTRGGARTRIGKGIKRETMIDSTEIVIEIEMSKGNVGGMGMMTMVKYSRRDPDRGADPDDAYGLDLSTIHIKCLAPVCFYTNSKRISGFDIAPPVSATFACGVAVGLFIPIDLGQIPGTSLTSPGMFPYIFPFATRHGNNE
ncbi:hypothetical protein FNV43_RR24586 [Rhamnella rubrinervis]|uniref:Uncharacterized protein n=1 Tax=Rhamnella rubrinervis TaxID=2594499 RepID=A0A8K0DSJ3_9ROSA|nr:hypothetical protein FNV43_RR24586 [Rhamnella rubrinervis]